MFGLRPLGRAPLGTAGVAAAQKSVLAVASNAPVTARVISAAKSVWRHNGFNAIRNPVGDGGAIGMLPTNWGLSSLATGVVTCAGAGFENGAPYVDLAYAMPSSGAAGLVFFDATNAIAAAVGQTWFQRVSIKIVSGSFTGTAFIAWVLYDSTPAVIYNSAPGANFTLGSSYVSVSDSLTLATANTAYIRPAIGLGGTSGAAQNFTIRVLFPVAYQTANAPAQALKGGTRMALALNAAAASVVRNAGKLAAAVGSAVATVTRGAGKLLAAAGGAVANLRRGAARTVAASAQGAASITRSLGKLIAASGNATALMTRQAGKLAAASNAATGIVTRSIARSFAASAAGVALMGKGLALTLRASAAGVVSLLFRAFRKPVRAHVVSAQAATRGIAPGAAMRAQSAPQPVRVLVDRE